MFHSKNCAKNPINIDKNSTEVIGCNCQQESKPSNMKLSTLKLKYINSLINDTNFPYQEMPEGNLELFNLVKEMTGQEILDEIEKQGLRPATIHEMCEWLKENEDFEGYLLTLGSRWANSVDDVLVPYACVNGANRDFNLGNFRGQFDSSRRVLVSRRSKSVTSSLGSSVPSSEPNNPLAVNRTLLDYFAGKAMQALLQNRCFPWDEAMPRIAFRIAQAMLKERENYIK